MTMSFSTHMRRALRRIYAQIEGAPIRKHRRAGSIRRRKYILMKDWHPKPLFPYGTWA